ncbi:MULTISPECIES: acyl carrier protein [unclassified Oleiphilus]|jgi:acyl carrier protein|uniref:acyl carrier protein n=1 Tax=unclassified Oleiphilus TaxID=2631174 RepID=UPI0007C36389|nr:MULTISPECIES: acyl carrier protein [unclassified Oleiphilus]KZY46086.1 acyl carrier protein [Oleiphilus sp. HI0050]KZY73768.1 acyl carrier protein [Oleiphilus sp. HI0068]KZY77028.1 acyl carrier protein [Oleiphilus sp. HI0069]KZY86125.1 acyl carrier protein [Oleiphilus sp. HI0072]KZZ11545.1 acyl carrier protein [Oleiphilus sp. HI0078]KZZ19377.1 acyl carrier protein [Oleiphilus sp. HI0081]KZZ32641.1 acyl carrier protein [Oleiphilus sp. HI0085]
MSNEATLRTFILENYMFTDNQDELKNDDSFLDKGILDSMGILEVIALLEDDFNITVEDEEMVPENLDSINNLLAYISKKSA